MPLTLTVTSYQRLSPGQDAVKVIDRCDATIGRGQDNDWMLPDPEHVLSKHHCSIHYHDGGYFLTDVSTNGVFVNQSKQRLGRGETIRLNGGDQLTLGEYQIQVSLTPDEGGSDEETLIGRPLDLFAAPQPSLQPVPSPASPDLSLGQPFTAAASTPSLPEEPIIPEDIDLLDIEWSPPPPPSPATVPDHTPPERDFFQPPKPRPEMSSQAQPEPLIPQEWSATGAAPVTPPTPEPVQEPAAPQTEPPVPAPTASEQEPSPPVEVAPPPSPAAHIPLSPERAPASGDNAALQSFLAGAGLAQLPVTALEAPELMTLVGQMFRLTVAGLRKVLLARSTIKRDIGARDMTLIGPTGNNPLKFSVSAEEAIKVLLTRQGSAYMSPLQALQEGFDDIEAHELAMLAGFQSALKHLLKRFDPATLEARLGQQSVLNTLLSGSRKARYWDLFTARYAEIAEEAEEDIQELFGKEFARAYEEQARKISTPSGK